LRKGFRLVITIAVLMIIAGCGGSGGPGGTASDKYYTIKYSVNDKDSKSFVAKNLQHTKEVSAPDDTTKPEVIPEEIGENRYFVNDPIAAGVMINATNSKEVFAWAGAMCQVCEVDRSSGNQVVIEDCTWSCEDPAVGKVTNSTNNYADFSFSVRGKTNVIAKTPGGVEVKIPAHVYPYTMLNFKTEDMGDFLVGFKFADETTSDESAADIYIEPTNGEVTINGDLWEVDQPFAQITEAPTDAPKYTLRKTFNFSEVQLSLFSNAKYIMKTTGGKYVKFCFRGISSSGSDHSVTIQYFVADSGTKFQY
jgi:hypothetical protein